MSNQKIHARLSRLPLLLLLACLTACSGVLTSEQPAKQYYLLMPLDQMAVGNPAEEGPALTLSVTTVPGLDTDRILALGADASLNRYANARWPDHLPEVLASVMKRSLASSGKFSEVDLAAGAPESGVHVDIEVRQFYGVRNSAGDTTRVLVEMGTTIGCDGRSAGPQLSESSTVVDERLSGVVAAHQSALDGVTRLLLSEIDRLCLQG